MSAEVHSGMCKCGDEIFGDTMDAVFNGMRLCHSLSPETHTDEHDTAMCSCAVGTHLVGAPCVGYEIPVKRVGKRGTPMGAKRGPYKRPEAEVQAFLVEELSKFCLVVQVHRATWSGPGQAPTTSGCADLLVFSMGKTFSIECKEPTTQGIIRPEQKNFEDTIHGEDAYTFVCRSKFGAEEIIKTISRTR